MAKGIYVGVADKARKVKSIYVGVDGKARKVKKVYVGDANGKARLCWSSELSFATGTITGSGATLTISGLSFKPKGIMAVCTSTSNGSGIPTFIPPTGDWYSVTIYAGGNYNYSSYNSNITSTTITYGSNSVTLKITSSKTSHKFNGTYQYAIWG